MPDAQRAGGADLETPQTTEATTPKTTAAMAMLRRLLRSGGSALARDDTDDELTDLW